MLHVYEKDGKHLMCINSFSYYKIYKSECSTVKVYSSTDSTQCHLGSAWINIVCCALCCKNEFVSLNKLFQTYDRTKTSITL